MRYFPGTFCWVGLAASDPEVAKTFYGGLFGWEFRDRAASGIGSFATAVRGSQAVALLYGQTAEARAAGVLPHWTAFLSVDDADRAAARASELGGSMVRDSFDVGDLARVATVRDPSGAIVSLWEPRVASGAEARGAVGSLGWNELSTPDPEHAATFYTELLDWRCTVKGSSIVIRHAGVVVGVIREQLADERRQAPNWLPCFGVDDLDAARRTATAFGGRVLGREADTGSPLGARTIRIEDLLRARFSVAEHRDEILRTRSPPS